MAALILAGDIGGTKSHLGLYRFEGATAAPIGDRIYATGEFSSLEEMCAGFLSEHKCRAVGAACFGVPGPVIGGNARATNIGWKMAESGLSRALGGAPVRLINDLSATAFGAIHLPQSELAVLQQGSPAPSGNIAVLAAGTGLGESALVFEAGRYHVVPSEGGHADFAARSDEQFALYKVLAARFDHVSIERVLSGPGLVSIYRFLRERAGIPEPRWLTERLEREDAAAVVSETALARRDAQCVHALEMFVDVYGAEAGNLALRVLALGGVYVGGGIAPKILPMMRDGRFMRAFLSKGRMTEMLQRVAVRVSLNEGAALLGAAHFAAAILG